MGEEKQKFKEEKSIHSQVTDEEEKQKLEEEKSIHSQVADEEEKQKLKEEKNIHSQELAEFEDDLVYDILRNKNPDSTVDELQELADSVRGEATPNEFHANHKMSEHNAHEKDDDEK